MSDKRTHRRTVWFGIILLAILWFLRGKNSLWIEEKIANHYQHHIEKQEKRHHGNMKRIKKQKHQVNQGNDGADEAIVPPVEEPIVEPLPERLAYLVGNDYTTAQSLVEFNGDELLTRGSSTLLLNAYASASGIEKKVDATRCVFSDIGGKSRIMQERMIESCHFGLLRGSNGDFVPDRIMLSNELLVTMVRSKVGYLNEDAEPWYKEYYNTALAQGMIPASVSLESYEQGYASKRDLGVMIYNIMNK